MGRASLCFPSLSSGTERKDEPSAMSFETLSEANSSTLRLPRKDKTDGPDSNHFYEQVFNCWNEVGKIQ